MKKQCFQVLMAVLFIVIFAGSNVNAQTGGQAAIDRVVGTFGVGYLSAATPIGVRHWLDNSLGLDIGLNIDMHKEEDVKAGETTSVTDTAIDLGGLYLLNSTESTIVFARGGLAFIRSPEKGSTKSNKAIWSSNTNMIISAMLGAELFLDFLHFPNISFSGGVGYAINYTSLPEVAGKSESELSFKPYRINFLDIFSNAAANFSFHIYF